MVDSELDSSIGSEGFANFGREDHEMLEENIEPEEIIIQENKNSPKKLAGTAKIKKKKLLDKKSKPIQPQAKIISSDDAIENIPGVEAEKKLVEGDMLIEKIGDTPKKKTDG
jgi:hypothetical protein